mgnify:CR=1 FL=1
MDGVYKNQLLSERGLFLWIESKNRHWGPKTAHSVVQPWCKKEKEKCKCLKVRHLHFAWYPEPKPRYCCILRPELTELRENEGYCLLVISRRYQFV